YNWSTGLLSGVTQSPNSQVWSYDPALGTPYVQGYGTYTSVTPAASGPLVNPALTAAPLGSVEQLVDDQGRQDTYQYDADGRPLEHTRPDGLTETWALDSHGQTTDYTDFSGTQTSYDYVYGLYDPLQGGGDGDLVSIHYADATQESYRYDPTFHQVT